ncbi:uncharacterized protein TrAtP1_009248 [Trichoderma atroviride]|uniref:uncharacterized protein n=1 Tax=Hypocrea atroviridis TaxID=63577 RepID=UPI0033262E66|nr:hypothetical protein TrAtP1_009248 [Trichoderma atroviride]
MATTNPENSLSDAIIASTYPEYSLNNAIAAFFTKTSVTRPECDARAIELTEGKAIPVEGQGNYSYSIYASLDQEYVVQFRLKSLELKDETSVLARKIFGQLAPSVSFKGKMGEETSGKEPLYAYVLERMKGVTQIDFILASGFPKNSQETFTSRENLIVGVAKFFALSWNAPQQVDPVYRDQLQKTYTTELTMLQTALPDLFQPIIKECIESIDNIFSLPMVLLHQDFSSCNIMVDEKTCHLTGVIDWAEAEVAPFGLNLYTVQGLAGHFHLRDGWSRYDDFDHLQSVFWSTFHEEVGDLSEETLCTIKLARTTGLLLSRGFTNRLANQHKHVPIGNDEQGRYNRLFLDGLLISADTRFD